MVSFEGFHLYRINRCMMIQMINLTFLKIEYEEIIKHIIHFDTDHQHFFKNI